MQHETPKPATGSVRLSGNILTITTQAKRGKKMVPLMVQYLVANLDPHPQVAYPAFSLTKGTLVKAACDDAAFFPRFDDLEARRFINK